MSRKVAFLPCHFRRSVSLPDQRCIVPEECRFSTAVSTAGARKTFQALRARELRPLLLSAHPGWFTRGLMIWAMGSCGLRSYRWFEQCPGTLEEQAQEAEPGDRPRVLTRGGVQPLSAGSCR